MPTPARFPARQDAENRRKPEWLRVRLPRGDTYERVRELVARTGLSTVCREALCPNVGECWGSGTATVMLMGNVCTRACKFCHVQMGAPAPLNPNEPDELAQAVSELGLTYVVVTSVNRDDLADGGAGHFARAVRAVHERSPGTIVETLIPDFQGSERDLATVASARPEVIAHNLETVERLTPCVRDRRASYASSLKVLEFLKGRSEKPMTKSSVMVGMGETDEELVRTFRDLRGVGVEILTVGQYLQPSPYHLRVDRFRAPEDFTRYEAMARELGFRYVASGPLVRSSYRAAELFVRGALALSEGDAHETRA